jgi:valyl-tRNA synthetase
VIGDTVIYIPLAGVIDVDKERERLQKRLDKAIKDLAGVQRTLNDSAFISRAPEAVVAQKRTRLAELESEKEKLEANLRMLA